MSKLLMYLFPQYFILKSGYYLFEEFKGRNLSIIQTVKRAYLLVGLSFIAFILCFINPSFVVGYLLIHVLLVNHPFILNMIQVNRMLKYMSKEEN